MEHDRFGQVLTTQSAGAAAGYSEAVDRIFAMQLGSGPVIDAAIEADPDFALAHCVKARSLFFDGEAGEAVKSAARALELAAKATKRERQHAEIVDEVTRGDTAQTLQKVREHAQEYPRDAMPLSFALGVYGLFGFGGFNDYHVQQHELLESLAPAWDEDWWFLTGLGWSHVEIGNVGRGIDMLDRALEIKIDNAHAAHARAHGYYELGAAEEGGAFIANWLPHYDPASPLHGHLSWHQALFKLQAGETQDAVQLYLSGVSPQGSKALPMFTMVDSAAFLWRCHLEGYPLPAALSQELLSFTRSHFPKAGLPFVNLHAALAYALANDSAALESLNAGVTQLLAADQQLCGQMIARLCAGVSAYTRGDFASAARELQASHAELERIGGSHAQRDVVTDTLVSALLRAGEPDAARAQMNKRASKRASHLDAGWLNRLNVA